MATQPELLLENNLVHQLTTLGYEAVALRDESDMLVNLKRQLEKHNGATFTDGGFARVLNHLNKGNAFDRAKILRDRMHLQREDGSCLYLEFLNQEH